MIVVTGAAGFIGSCLIRKLNEENFNAIVAVDHFEHPAKKNNLTRARILHRVNRDHFFTWLDAHQETVEFIFHIGARTDTTEFSVPVFDRLNLNYSKEVWHRCVRYQIPLVYASSAATYGMGENGFDDDEEKIAMLRPLNPYGQSKQDFDVWALARSEKPFFWAGLKFFNVYGPNEYHKGRMASVIWHTFRRIQETGGMNLFRSHHPDYRDGGQMRDFVYVKDVVEVCSYLMHTRKHPGIYNLGSGQARTFLDLVRTVFRAIGQPEKISFIDTPADIRDTYQYFTEANMRKLRAAGLSKPFHTLEQGIHDYVVNYLKNGPRYF